MTPARSGVVSEGNRGRQQPGVDWCQKETEEDNSQEWTGIRRKQRKTTARSGLVSEGNRGRLGKTTARSGLESEGDRGRQQPGVNWCQKETEEDNSQE